MRRRHFRAAYLRDATIGRQDHDRCQRRFQRAVQECEALNIEHVDLVNEEDAGNQLGNALVDVAVDDLVDLQAELLRDLRLLRLNHLAHHRHDILAALRFRIGHIEVVQGHVLDDLLLLVNVALGQWDVLLRFQVELGGVLVASSDALDRSRVRLDVDHIADRHFLLLQALVDRRVQLQLLRAFRRLQRDHHVRYGLAVPAEAAVRLHRRQASDFAFPDLFVLLDSKADRPAEILHEDLGLLDLGGIDFRSDDGTERNAAAKFLRDCQRQCGLPRAGGSGQEESRPRHLLRPDQVDDNAGRLARLLLPDQAGGRLQRRAVLAQSQPFDMAVRRDPLTSLRRFDFLDLHGRPKRRPDRQ